MDRVEPDQADGDQVDGDDVVQEPRNDQDQNTGDKGRDGPYVNPCQIHLSLLGWWM